jgi:hypothetical protein
MLERIIAAVAVLSLSACGAPRLRPIAPPRPTEAFPSLQSLPPAGSYQVDSQNSELRVLVYRAGPLASLGHNHVMVNRAVAGLVQVGSSISESSFSLRVPVESFVVDDADARREEGAEFAGEVPEDAKAGTRRNMLGAASLDADEFPTIRVESVTLSGTLDALIADLTVNVAGHEASVSAPCTLQGDMHTLRAVGSMTLRQTAVGVTPFSLLHGALQVEDAMQLKFRIVVPIN